MQTLVRDGRSMILLVLLPADSRTGERLEVCIAIVVILVAIL